MENTNTNIQIQIHIQMKNTQRRDSMALLTAMCVNCKWMRAGQTNGAYRGFWGLEAESENLLYKYKYKNTDRKYKYKYRVLCSCKATRLKMQQLSDHMTRHTHASRRPLIDQN